MSTFISVIGGVFVYVITKMILDKIIEQMKLISEIEFNLNYYANVYSLPTGDDGIYIQAAELFRKLGALLLSTLSGIPCLFYYVFEKLGFLITKASIREASKALLSLSNGNLQLIYKDDIVISQKQTISDNIEDSKRIEKLLKITLWF